MKLKLGVFAFSFLVLCNVINASELYQSTAPLNIRAGMGKEFKVIGSIEKGEKIIIDTIINGWGRVLQDDRVAGYSSMKYLTTNFKDYSDSNNDSDDIVLKIGFVIIFIALGYAKWNEGSSKGDSKKSRSVFTPKPNLIKWYNCKHCGEKLQSLEKPKRLGCSRYSFHNWYELAEIGDNNYSCKHCGLIIGANTKPNVFGCPSSSFHSWNRL